MIEIVSDKIDISNVEESVRSDDCGAVLLFVGRSRDNFNGRKVKSLLYETYKTMAIKEMKAIATEIQEKWSKSNVSIVHRIGDVGIGEASVAIAVSTPHREQCYLASRYAIDQLKLRVPIWKKEHYEDGTQWKANQ